MTDLAEVAPIMTPGSVAGEPGLEWTSPRRLARLGLRRLRRVRRRIATLPRSGAAPRAGRVLDDLMFTLRLLPRPVRDRFLVGPDIRGYLSEAETWIETGRLTRLIPARSASGRLAAAGPVRSTARLFDLVSRTEHLVTLDPGDASMPASPGAAGHSPGTASTRPLSIWRRSSWDCGSPIRVPVP